MSVRFGACVVRAKLQATLGKPIPTKTTSPSRSSLAAAQIMASVSIIDARTHPTIRREAFDQSRILGEVLRAIPNIVHVFVEIALQSIASARDAFPRDVEVIVAILET